MKIGILTLHNGVNYGGTLQCYALQKKLTELGHSTEVINFIPSSKTSVIKKILFNFSTIRTISDIKQIFKVRISQKTRIQKRPNNHLLNIFDKFRKEHFKLSDQVNERSINKINDRYDAIIIGSDQVWGQFVRNDLTYLADWYPSFNGKLISYAACAISLNYPLVRKWKIIKLLKQFDSISVRDKLTQNLIFNLTGNRPKLVPDPTILYDFSQYTRIRMIKEPYIFVYVLGNEIKNGNQNAISKIQSIIGKIKVIAVTIYNENVNYADVTINNATPFEWINLIANSEFTFTDSYHGALFSLKHNHKFVAYYNDPNRSSRLIDLKNRWNLDGMIIDKIEDIDMDKRTNNISSILANMSIDGTSYLNTI